MKKNETKIYLNYLCDSEKSRMTDVLGFLRTGDVKSKDMFLKVADKLYGKGIVFNFMSNNGRCPDCAWANYRDKHFTVVMRFAREHISDEGIRVLGHNDNDDWDWRYFYGIAVGDDDRKVYAISYSNRCSPNWNHEYRIQSYVELSDFQWPLLNESGVVYSMDDSLHAAINDVLAEGKTMFTEEDGSVVMVVKDQHGNYTEIKGTSLDSVFRDYADNYTGYRNYRRQMASEWVIVDGYAREIFEEWKSTAKGLKSDFDKFYGGGIVD